MSAFYTCDITQILSCLLLKSLLLRSHQASQQTNFGRVRASLGFLRQYQLTYLRYLDVCMYITDFASIPSNRNRGYFLFRVESRVFAGEDVESK